MNSVTELQDVTVKEANRLITYLQDNISHIILLGIRILFAVVIFWGRQKDYSNPDKTGRSFFCAQHKRRERSSFYGFSQ